MSCLLILIVPRNLKSSWSPWGTLIVEVIIDHGSPFVTYGTEMESKRVQLPWRDAPDKINRGGYLQSPVKPVIAWKYLPLCHRNTRLGCVLTNVISKHRVLIVVFFINFFIYFFSAWYLLTVKELTCWGRRVLKWITMKISGKTAMENICRLLSSSLHSSVEQAK